MRLGGAALKSARPNPFREETAIDFEVEQSSVVALVVLDARGTEVARLIDGAVAAGSYTATFDGTRLSSGIYFCELRTPTQRLRLPILLIQ